jgi:hypothetical protein
MTKDVKKLAERIEELEAEVQRMKTQSREVHHHHYPQPYVVPQPYVSPWRVYPWAPQPTITWGTNQQSITTTANDATISWSVDANTVTAPFTLTSGLAQS